jgi:vitamin B12 transporter
MNSSTLITSVVLLCSFAVASYAQQKMDTTLQEVKVHGKHKVSNDERVNEFSPGQKIKTIDTAMLQQYQLQNMANLLSQQVPVFVKSYGFNGLATLNFRGSSSAQSAVFWNGIPIQNAALGVADISTLPVLLVNKVNIVYGGSSGLWGSGNVGGALLIENDMPVFDAGKKTLSLVAGAGSFGQYSGGFKGSVSGRRWYFSANALVQTAQNNFSYTNNVGAKTNMTNGHLQSGAAMMQLGYKIKPQIVLNLYVWLQQYDRQIPPSLFETNSVKTQVDGSLRTLLSWDMRVKDTRWYIKSSVVRDEIHYKDDAVEIRSDNVVYQYYQEAGWKRSLHQYGDVLVFIPVQTAWLQQASGTKQQDKAALAGAYSIKLFNKRLDLSVNARAEAILEQTRDTSQQHNIFLPGVNASFAVKDWLSLRANVQRSYRTPTLNELYYFPGGNISLKPEQGWSEDAGYTVKVKTGAVTLFHDLSVFSREIRDWIYWVGGAIWTPHNIAAVHSRGVETENNITFSAGKWQLHIGVNTAYVLATTTASYFNNDGSIGKQIPYTPRYNGQLNAGFSYQRFSFNYNHTYTGYRFTTTDESAYTLPYQTGNIQMMYNALLYKHSLQLTAQCNNIWNEKYQVVDQRPMPGLNWLLGIKAGIL